MQESLKLSEFLKLIKSTIDMSFGYQSFWVIAELSEWRRSGKHYYGELVEYDDVSKYPLAKIRCNCWSDTIDYVNDKFSAVTGELLRSDVKILLKVSVNYHISFGLSLNILDIDPAFTLGDRQVRKLEILDCLNKKSILQKNKTLYLPQDFTKVAVITSITAAGKDDFFKEANKLQAVGLCQFDIYAAKMQGKDCSTSISSAFAEIQQSKTNKYDAIVIIRGGGSQADLDCFNNILLAETICNSWLPVMIGIGHKRDNTVLDQICTRSFDTPSKVIGFIVNKIIDNTKIAKHNYNCIVRTTRNLVRYNQSELKNLHHDFKITLEHYLYNLDQKIQYNHKNILRLSKDLTRLCNEFLAMYCSNLIFGIQNLAKQYTNIIDKCYKDSMKIAKGITKHYDRINKYLYKQVLSASIKPTLRRGFSITRSKNGKYVTSQEQARSYSNLDVIYADGKIQVEVKNVSTK